MGEADLVKSRRALLLIDFINPLDFPEAGALAAPALEAARASRHLARAARSRGIPVIYANDNFGRWQSDFPTMVKRLGQGRDVSASIVRLLRPQRGDLTVLKPMRGVAAEEGDRAGLHARHPEVRHAALAQLALAPRLSTPGT